MQHSITQSTACDQLSAFNASHRVHNKPYDHRLHKGISQSDSTESHSLRQGSSSFRCLSSGLFSPLQLYTCKNTQPLLSQALEASSISALHLQLQLIHEWKVLHDRMKTGN